MRINGFGLTWSILWRSVLPSLMTDYPFDPERMGDPQAILARYGTSYSWATRLLPKPVRADVAMLYAWVRFPDELVDNPPPGQDSRKALAQWREDWNTACASAVASDHRASLAVQSALLFQRKGISSQCTEAFLDSMERDLTVDRYKTYQDLEGYMYGSAAVVGRMMVAVLGVPEAERAGAYPGADALGYAMQLTNFLRDIGEDYRERGRIYIPQEDMKTFGVAESDIAAGMVTDGFGRLMAFEIDRARALYNQAERAIFLLPPRSRFGVRVASRLYGAILDEIEKNGYDVFRQRARTGNLRKLRLTLSSLTLFNRTAP